MEKQECLPQIPTCLRSSNTSTTPPTTTTRNNARTTGLPLLSQLICGGHVTSYNSWGKTNSYDIIVGYDPPMDDYKKAWLDEHNERREAFHEKNGKKYRPLRWSSELARDASAWVDEILPTCKIVREPGLEEGENIAIHRYSENQGPSDNETPSTILARWSDAKLRKDYTDNQTMTQVMWRASRYVGCASKSVMNAEDGAYCYVSICRYSRPGNCSMRSGNWLDVTLRDHSRCGKACPGEGCH